MQTFQIRSHCGVIVRECVAINTGSGLMVIKRFSMYSPETKIAINRTDLRDNYFTYCSMGFQPDKWMFGGCIVNWPFNIRNR